MIIIEDLLYLPQFLRVYPSYLVTFTVCVKLETSVSLSSFVRVTHLSFLGLVFIHML